MFTSMLSCKNIQNKLETINNRKALNSRMLSFERGAKSTKGQLGRSIKSSKSVATKFQPPTHPAIVVTSAFTAPHIDKLKKKFEELYIPYGMQTSKKKVNRPPGAPTDKNFVVADDSLGPPILEGEFLGLKMCRVDYPKKNNLDEVIKKFDKYIGLGKQTVEEEQDYEETGHQNRQQEEQIQKLSEALNKNKGDPISRAGGPRIEGMTSQLNIQNFENVLEVKQKMEQFKNILKKGKQNGDISDSSSSKDSKGKKKKNKNKSKSKNKQNITLKSVKRYGEQPNLNIQKRILFILMTQKQSQRYQQHIRQFQNCKNKRIIIISSLQEYLTYCYANGEGENCMLLSPNVAFQELHKFRNLKDVYIYGDDPKFCAQLVKGNIKKAAIDPEKLDQILIQQGFDKEESKDLVEPLRKVGGKMGDPEEQNEKDDKSYKPSLFQRFVGFMKGKSKPKQNNSREKPQQEQPIKQKAKTMSKSSKSDSNSKRSSSSKSKDKKKNKPQLQSKGVAQAPPSSRSLSSQSEQKMKVKKGLPVRIPQRAVSIPISPRDKEMISLGRMIIDNSINPPEKVSQKSQDTQQGNKPKQPTIKILKVKSIPKIPNPYIESEQYKNSEKPQQFKLQLSSNPSCNEVQNKEPVKPNRKVSLSSQDKVLSRKQEPKQILRAGIRKRSSQGKQIKFCVPKNDKKPKKLDKKRSSSSSSPCSSSSSSNNMAQTSKRPPSDKKRKMKNDKKQEYKIQDHEEDLVYQAKPEPKDRKENRQRKASLKNNQVEESYYQSVKIKPDPKDLNKLLRKLNKKIQPDFHLQKPAPQQENYFQFSQNYTLKDRSISQKEQKQNFVAASQSPRTNRVSTTPNDTHPSLGTPKNQPAKTAQVYHIPIGSPKTGSNNYNTRYQPSTSVGNQPNLPYQPFILKQNTVVKSNPSNPTEENNRSFLGPMEPRNVNLPFDESKYDRFFENGLVIYRPKQISKPIPIQHIQPQSIQPPYVPFINMGLQQSPLQQQMPITPPNQQKKVSVGLETPLMGSISTQYGQDAPMKSTASTYYRNLNKNPSFSTYEYFMNKEQLPVSPHSPNRVPPQTERVSPPYKSVYNSVQSQLEDPVRTCNCHKSHSKPRKNKRPSSKNKQNPYCPHHICQDTARLQRKLTKTRKVFNLIDSDSSNWQEQPHLHKKSKSTHKPVDPFSSILDNMTSRVMNPSKNYSILYLVHTKLNPKIIKQLFELSDQSDTIQTYSQDEKMMEIIRKGENVFDYILVFQNREGEENLGNLKTVRGLFNVEYQPEAYQSTMSNKTIILKNTADLPLILTSSVSKIPAHSSKQSKIGHIYFKDFNQPIRNLAKMLKNQYPTAQIRRYFGLMDLPTRLPLSRHEMTIILLDQVNFNETSQYCRQQQQQNPKIIKICIPKSPQALHLCQKSSGSERIVWLTEKQLDSPQFILKRIEKRLR